MKEIKTTMIAVLLVLSLGAAGCVEQIGSIGGDFLVAATISDADLKQMSREMRAVGDKENTVATSKNKYGSRLAGLTNRLKKEDGLDLNFKAYVTKEANANATADGSIRVYSGLMDMMTDDELLFIVGHEIGHVKMGHSLSQIRMAYASSGAIKAAQAGAGAAGGVGVVLAESQLGSLLHTVINAQYSQSDEYESDAYGYRLLKKYKRNPKAAVTALQKIDKLGESGGILSSHPNSGDRADTIAAMIKNGE